MSQPEEASSFPNTKKLNKHLGIWLHPLKVYHPRTEGQFHISNTEVEKYVQHFAQYHKLGGTISHIQDCIKQQQSHFYWDVIVQGKI